MPLILDKIQSQFGDAVLETHSFRGDDTVLAKKEALLDLARFLKGDSELNFDILMDLTAVDYLPMEKPYRFEVVYHFYSFPKNHRVRIKVPVTEDNLEVPSLTDIWPIADWFEREVWDMFGIKFKGHPNLKRILMYEEFVGYPLRKDYPVNKRQPLIGPKN